ncbi:ATP-dependent helicase, partial [bacterium AH-315-C07]|nr:ATP-dependent helicase [bacterium AH-315-C07]
MGVVTTQPAQIVYALYEHSHLGFLIEPHIVQINSKGSYTLSHQKLFVATSEDFDDFLDSSDYKLIRILEGCDQRIIVRKYSDEKTKPAEFFTGQYYSELQVKIRSEIDDRIGRAFELLMSKQVFVMGTDGNPTWKQIKIAAESASVLFHFKKENGSTRYYPTIKYQDTRISFIRRDAKIICDKPALMLLDGVVYHFEDKIDGKKLKPFLTKAYIEIPKSSEETYFKTFVVPLIERHKVYIEGFDVVTQKFQAKPILKIESLWGEDVKIGLYFKYGENVFPFDESRRTYVALDKQNGAYRFFRIARSFNWESNKVSFLRDLGLHHINDCNFFLHVDPEDELSQLNLF